MSQISRLEPDFHDQQMVSCDGGDYVRYEDHLAALAQARREEREVSLALITFCRELIREIKNHCESEDHDEQLTQLQQWEDAIRAREER